MKRELRILYIVVAILVIVLSSISTYATSVISANSISYTDNSNLGVADVQAAIDGTCTKFSSQLSSLKENIIDTIYPVGSIYTSETDSTVASVQNRFKAFGKETTWVVYSQGKVLVGSGTGTDSNGTTQTFSVSNNSKNLGEYEHQLTVSELAQHRHNQLYVTLGETDTGVQHWFGGSTASTWSTTKNYGVQNQNITTDYEGRNQSHNNIQPYTTVYMYKRIK